ncbi:MAG TPA: ATP synthase F1 subunit delta [Bdellovibrionales bacterium]|nr:MAG: ATP synthase F1 subunit delta [Bdellovibrionales bacterium GWB1_52_6]OFZ04410.1 MAG: ATP synthase F1 subunit delta [Bdellovibrionales bacterium GWA1_52_35]OFZ35640.1 MAG: ATP synthase F1 subunit delta [Bdellovibrionales bacterium GWC1_52_8]HAR42216.1 ATP synthase F1 subunit delta [Bdellovibrionales bacterium]HCM40734.1 ATP synthase F1 subunit delta [Bdellovibrionales bacterium]
MSVAHSYAKALYEAAIDSTKTELQLDQIAAEIDKLVALVAGHKELRIVLNGPLASAKEKGAVLDAVFSKSEAPKLVLDFLKLLARKGRFSELPAVREAFYKIRLAANGGMAGTLVSAEQLATADIEELTNVFSKKLGKKVAFEVSTDSSLLAGVKAHVGGVTYDGTLRAELERLRDRLTI